MQQLCYRADTMDGTIWALGELRGEIAGAMPTLQRNEEVLNYGAFQLYNGFALDAMVMIDESYAKLNCALYETARLAQYGRKVQNTYDGVEEQLANGISMLFSLVFPGITAILRINETREQIDKILKECNEKLDQAQRDFEGIIASILIAAKTTADTLKSDLDISHSALLEDIKYAKIKINSTFKDMDIWRLIEQNPDIKRKGVMLGFNGEYWNPEFQQQCTLYAAARRTQIGNPLPMNGAWGNANAWANSARNSGLTVSKVPQKGDVFCEGGYYGHVGVVEKVHPDGSIDISEGGYIKNGQYGQYNTRTLSAWQYANWEFIK